MDHLMGCDASVRDDRAVWAFVTDEGEVRHADIDVPSVLLAEFTAVAHAVNYWARPPGNPDHRSRTGWPRSERELSPEDRVVVLTDNSSVAMLCAKLLTGLPPVEALRTYEWTHQRLLDKFASDAARINVHVQWVARASHPLQQLAHDACRARIDAPPDGRVFKLERGLGNRRQPPRTALLLADALEMAGWRVDRHPSALAEKRYTVAAVSGGCRIRARWHRISTPNSQSWNQVPSIVIYYGPDRSEQISLTEALRVAGYHDAQPGSDTEHAPGQVGYPD